MLDLLTVSTHSRAEAAAFKRLGIGYVEIVSTHSRAEAAAHGGVVWYPEKAVSTHSRAEAAAFFKVAFRRITICFNTQPRGSGCCLA